MANEHLKAAQIVLRAAGRALPARKFVKLVQGWSTSKELESQVAQDEIASALLSAVLRSSTPPAILLGYLTLSLSSGVISVTTLLTHVVYAISDGQTIPISVLVTLSTLCLSNIPLDYALPSSLRRPGTVDTPSSDPGPSNAPSSSTPTLALLIPFIRQCCLPATPPSTIPALIGRLLTALQPYPAPPLDVSLEAGSLTSALPETVAAPLRDCLSWFMADFAVTQGAAPMNINDVPAPTAIAVPAPAIASDADRAIPVPALPPFSSSISLSASLEWEISHILRSNRWTNSDPTMLKPPENHIALLRLAPLFATDASVFLRETLAAAVRYHEGVPKDETVQRWLFATERLPILLKYWKGTSDLDYGYPDDLKDALISAITSEKEGLNKYNAWISTTLTKLVQTAEDEDESGGFSQPEGWMLCSLQVTIIQRLLELGLLQRSDASAILPGMTIPAIGNGESLTARIGSAPKSHLKALSHIVAFAPGAAVSLAKEAYEAVRSSPGTQPLEGLFVNLAQEPTLLACVGGCINGASWFEVIKSQLLDHPDDPAARIENPQDSKSRFGEGVILAEAFVSQYELPFPSLMRDARRAVSLGDLDPSKRSCINGWIKALFGPDGIDDEIILATTPAEFYRLAAGVIQQSILATAAGQIDIDTLHSGLSYFSQPLLSWSLGGIVEWLADEIIRNGPISALHLEVLQTLVTSSAFPDSVLRVSGRKIANILQPTSGLQDVLKTSAFDVSAVKQKLDGAGVIPSSEVTHTTLLRQSLVNLQQIGIAPISWATGLIVSIETASRADGSTATIGLVTTDFLSLLLVSETGDGSSACVLALAMAQQAAVDSRQSWLHVFSETTLPSLFDSASSPLLASQTAASATAVLARTLKQALLVSAYADPTGADKHADVLFDELLYQRSRPLKRAEKEGKPKKRVKVDDISSEGKAALDAMLAALSGDEELKRRWPRFSELKSA